MPNLLQPLLVSVPAAAELLGIAAKTARNWDSQGKFPVPTHRLGGRRLVRLSDIHDFVASLTTAISAIPASQPVAAPVRKRGRPTKAAQIANAQQRAKGVDHA